MRTPRPPAPVTVSRLAAPGRRARRARETRRTALTDGLQLSDDASRTASLLLAHAEAIAPGASAALLEGRDGEAHLSVRLGERAVATPLRALLDAESAPRACRAIASGGACERADARPTPAGCVLCGALPGALVCEPLSGAGRTEAALLVLSATPVGVEAREELRDGARRTAPVLALQRALALAERRAAHDALTGLPNRRAAHDTLARLAAQAGRALSPLAAILVDLDHFGDLEVRVGRAPAERVLAAVARALGDGVRGGDLVARWGGQSFLVLAPDTSRPGAAALAEKLRAELEGLVPLGVGRVTASFGVAAIPEDAGDPERLLRGAERALGMAKALGRNRVAGPGFAHPPG